MAAGDDGSVSDSAMLFGQLPDDRRRQKNNPDTTGGKSSATGGAASSKTSSGNLLRLPQLLLLTYLLTYYNLVSSSTCWNIGGRTTSLFQQFQSLATLCTTPVEFYLLQIFLD